MISIVFVSNFFNHHERFLCDEMYKMPNVDFKFVQTVPMTTERRQLGWEMNLSKFPYVMYSYGNKNEYQTALDMCNNADVLILGEAPYEFVARRVKLNKLTFYYAERLFRKGIWHMINPRTFFTVLKRFIIPGRKSNFYLLAASAYTSVDTFRIFAFNQGRFKWGHFIEVGYPKQRIDNNGDILQLLWVGRFLPLKHPDYAVKVAECLKKQGVNFHLNIIGSGVLESELKRMISSKGLHDVVTLHSPKAPQEIRSFMERADIYMFTSDFNEGWGAVLGEAMASGCAVVTGHGIGATPFLVEHNRNGLIFETGNYNSFERNVFRLIKDKNLRAALSEKAIETMQTQWNAKTAAVRFYLICESILTKGQPIYFEKGPLSKAELLYNNWFRDDTI